MFLTSASMMFALRLSECYHRGPEKTSSKELSKSYQAWEKGVNSALKAGENLVRQAQAPFGAKENALPAYRCWERAKKELPKSQLFLQRRFGSPYLITTVAIAGVICREAEPSRIERQWIDVWESIQMPFSMRRSGSPASQTAALVRPALTDVHLIPPACYVGHPHQKHWL